LPPTAQHRQPSLRVPSDAAEAVNAAAAEIDALRRRESALRVIVGSRNDGRDFITAAAEALAIGLNYRWAGIGRLLPDGRRVQLLAMWQDGAAVHDLFAYDLADTPCAEVFGTHRYSYYADRIVELFPQDLILVDMGAVCYRGEPFLDDSGRPIGHVFGLNDRADNGSEVADQFVHLIASWVGTEFRRREAELASTQAKELAEQAGRAKDAFLANMTHELRTPLNAIIGFSDVLRQEIMGPLGAPEYREYADDINASGSHLLTLVNNILDVAKLGTSPIELADESVDCAALTADCLRLVKQQARNGGVMLHAALPTDLPPIRGDALRLKQIVLNLLSNAVKFTPAGGRVTIAAEIEASGNFALQVRDTGIGISADQIAKVVLPFYQVQASGSRRGGTGLGLSLAKALVELHGGSLDLVSRLGAGTTATVRLPPERLLHA
jgi:two-component system, cell cycle sensor histidine kinase PleC